PDDRRLPVVEGGREERTPQAPDAAVEVDRLAAALPQPADDRERFLEAADALREPEAVRLRVLALAVADAEDRAPARQVIERDEGLRQRRGMAAERLGPTRPDPHAAVARRHRSHHDERIEERVGGGDHLRCRREAGPPHRTWNEAAVVVGDEQRVGAEELRESDARLLEAQ